MLDFTPPNPWRYVHHLPCGARAASLEEALEVLTKRHGEGFEERPADDLVATRFEDEDGSVRVFRATETNNLIAILSQPATAIQMFIRPCSGWGV